MIIVIDGYNLLHAIPQYKKTITERERNYFIANLAGYAALKGHKIVLVFDGGPSDWPTKESHKKVEVVYSGTRESADDYIKEYIEKHRAKDLLLVSTDRELNNYAASFGVPSIDAYEFYQVLRDAKNQIKNGPQQSQTVVKTAVGSKEYVDMLMMNASKMVPEKAEDVEAERKSRIPKQRKLSKQERALLKKVGKL